MPKSSKTLHKEFLLRANKLNNVRISFENALAIGAITDTDIIQAYAGLYFDLFTDFERAIEGLFLGLLNGDIKHNQVSVNRKLKISPKSEVENVVHHGRPYIDWLPYEKTTDLAKIYFVDKYPFDFINESDKKELKNYLVIRNAIGHKSKSSFNKFRELH